MKITDIRFGMLRVPLKTPFKTALRSVDQVEDIVVMVNTDSGHVGYGEAPATAVITGDTHGSIIEAIRHYISPRLVGHEIADLNHLTHLIQGAMERARLRLGLPATIGVDIERVKAIYAAVEGRALLRLDANQGWTAKQAVYALQTLEDAGVRLELVEQPVKAHDLDGMKYITERVHTPVMADESVFGPMEVIELIRMRAADIVNIKLMKTGGLSNAIRIADIAAIYGVDCMIGCMLEGSISVAAAVHLAVAKSHAITKIDLDGPSLCAFNPVDGGVLFNDSEISVTDAPGLGIREIRGLELVA